MTETRTRLVDATITLMRERGFGATSVEQICTSAGVSKGAFFHYFGSKEAIAATAAEAFSKVNEGLIACAVERGGDGRLARLRCFLDLLDAVASDPTAERSCLVGNLAQEVSATHDTVRSACCAGFESWGACVSSLLSDARDEHVAAGGTRVDFSPDDVATMLTAVMQGAMLMAKAQQAPDTLRVVTAQYRTHVQALLPGADLEPSAGSCC